MELNATHIALDEELVLRRRKFDRDQKPPFTMFGNGDTNRMGKSMDIIDALTSLTPASAKLFKVMLRKRNVDTNQLVLRGDELGSPRLIGNHFPLLQKNGLVIRTSNNHYMINPDLVVPNNYRSAKLEWNSLLNRGLSTEQEEPTR